ncbi:PAS domain S-box protein [Halosegnis rubeus]|jgi:PAS domain S-box-containing protein|uniref:histidine kinase n=1 Tax=Halosegnis rubeus TaxID=2212850 RepID=A0A5N5UN02_9EURY|nr:PAS domain-containing sensor histidine kinase [Halosegnis rubeus]KAB7513964.1 PAS domain S-box protein [Halosegnis rubeus]KAB7514365.1 PAS domain S-box protein [Halosegnis rubeus]KAB7518723.1 PAS domain S-box protein [Halosegnis rubeus]
MVVPHEASDSDADRSGVREAASRRLIEGVATHAIFNLDSDGNILTWPAPAEQLYGYDETTILGQHVRTLFADEARAEPDSLPDEFFSQPKVDPVAVEQWHRRRDGSVFWGALTLSPLWNDTFHGYAAVSQDTTSEKEYERMLERQNDRLKEFTDILAHDLKNPLSVIDGNLTLYEETGEEKHLETVHETTERMAHLVDDLLRVAQQGDVVTDPEPTDIGAVIEMAWENLPGVSTASLHYESVESVSGDPERLCELFENLFQNSVNHGGNDVTVRVGPLESGFYLEDDGPGIRDEDKAEVFDHGFTTRSDGHGYGLSVVRTIVNAHGWDIIAADAQAGGARFEVTGIDFLD